MLVLQHGFLECEKDFNVVAAIIVLKDASYLSYKNSTSNRKLLRKSSGLRLLRENNRTLT
jgi:hypothetical protein